MNPGVLMIGAALLVLTYILYDEFVYRAPIGLKRQSRSVVARLRGVNWKAYLPLPVALFLAVNFLPSSVKLQPFMPPLMSLYILAVGILTSVYLSRRAQLAERLLVERQMLELVSAFLGVYRLRPSVFSALEEVADRLENPMRTYVNRAVEAYYATAQADAALDVLRQKVPSPFVEQFIYILRRTDAARHEAVLRALRGLIQRLRQHETLRERTSTQLSGITWQTLFILVISLGIVFVMAMTGLKRFYTESWSTQVFFIIVASVGVTTAYFIDRRINGLKERLL
jgi:Flp pilus assembly protein TadB